MIDPWLLGVGLALWASGAAVDLVAGPASSLGRRAPYALGALGSVPICCLGVHAVEAGTWMASLGSSLGTGQAVLRVDPLAGLFLTLTAGLGVLVSAALVSWSRPSQRIEGRGAGAGYLLLLGSVTVVLVAGDAFTFLFGWESLTAAFYVLSAVTRTKHGQAAGSWLTMGVSKIGGASLLLAFLLLAGRSGSLTLSAWTSVPPGAVHTAAWALVVIGFGAKVGLLPLQVWLPVGYPQAPGPARAAMAGLAANVGFYGLWRFLGILGRPPVLLVVVVLLVGGVTALLGIVFAAVQSRLDRVIAYSSIENAGVIVVAYGVALAGTAEGNPRLVAVGLLAASLQVLAHAVAKSGLFATSAFITADYRTDELDRLRGVGFRQRTAGAVFGVGAVTLAGLPPTIGFMSEWFVLESLMQELRVHDLALRLAMAAAGALVALTAGVAALTFTRLVGMTILGRSRAGQAPPGPPRQDNGPAGRAALVLLGAACLVPAALAPVVVRFLARGLGGVVDHRAVLGALKSPWVVQPVFPAFSALSPSWLWVTMPIGFVAVTATTVLVSGGRLLRVRRVPAWRSASGGVTGPDHYSSFGYANIVRHVLGNLLGARRDIVDLPSLQAGRHELLARSRVVEPVATYLYRPAAAGWLRLAAAAKRLQSGRLDAYISYMLVTLLVLLAVVAVIG